MSNSAKSLKSLGNDVRESLGVMHKYVDTLFKEVNTSKVLERTLKSEVSMTDQDVQDLEAINEI